MQWMYINPRIFSFFLYVLFFHSFSPFFILVLMRLILLVALVVSLLGLVQGEICFEVPKDMKLDFPTNECVECFTNIVLKIGTPEHDSYLQLLTTFGSLNQMFLTEVMTGDELQLRFNQTFTKWMESDASTLHPVSDQTSHLQALNGTSIDLDEEIDLEKDIERWMQELGHMNEMGDSLDILTQYVDSFSKSMDSLIQLVELREEIKKEEDNIKLQYGFMKILPVKSIDQEDIYDTTGIVPPLHEQVNETVGLYELTQMEPMNPTLFMNHPIASQ